MGLSGFVGNERDALVSRLSNDFQSITESGGVQVHVISGPAGIGKTRVVQEVFSAISGSQADGYWPGGITAHDDWKHSRKRMNPPSSVAPDGVSPSWIWWGLSCGRRADGTLESALIKDASHWKEHTARISRSRLSASGAGAALDITDAVVTSIGLLGVGAAAALTGGALPAVLSAAGVGRTVWQQRRAASSLVERISRRSHSEVDTGVSTTTVGGEQADLARAVARVSQRVPLVIAIDDVHWADSMLVQFVTQLAKSEKAKVLVLCTTWPQSGTTSANPWTESELQHLIQLHQLAPLGRESLTDIVAMEFAALGSPPPSRELADRIVDQVGSSPLAIRAACGVERIRHLIRTGALTTSSITQLPRDLEESLNAYWSEASTDVQFVLGLAALLGARFPSAPVVGAASTLGVKFPSGALQTSRTPLSLVRPSTEFVDLFAEPGFVEIAKRHAEEVLIPQDEQVLYDAVAEYAADLRDQIGTPGALTDILAAELCWRLHVTYAMDGLLPPAAASSSAVHLATLYWESGRPAEAIESCEDSAFLAEPGSEQYFLAKLCSGVFLTHSGSPDAANAVFTEAMKLLDDQEGNTDLWRLRFGIQIGVTLMRQARYFEAKDTFLSCRQLPESSWSTHEKQMLRYWFGTALLECREYNLGAQELESLFAELSADIAEDESDLDFHLSVGTSLSIALRNLGEYERVETLNDELLRISIETFGEFSPEVATIRMNRVVSDTSPYGDKTVEEVREIVSILNEGSNYYSQLEARIVLQEVLISREELQEPLAELGSLASEVENRLGPDHPLSLRTNNLHGLALLLADDLEAAELVLRECWKNSLRVLGPDNPAILRPAHNLADVLWKAKKWEDSVEFWEIVVNETQRLEPTVDISPALGMLWSAYYNIGKTSKAVDTLSAFVEAVSKDADSDPSVLLRANHTLARMCGEVGQEVRALDIWEELHTKVLGVLEPAECFVIRGSHAIAVGNSGNWIRGMKLLVEVHDDAERQLGADHYVTRQLTDELSKVAELGSASSQLENRTARRAAARRRKS